MQHITVLLQEAVDALALNSASVVVDATFGAGGHAAEIVSRLGSQGTYIGIDADDDAIAVGRLKLTGALPKVILQEANFSEVNNVLNTLEIKEVDAVLADLGWHSDQFITKGRGFSFADDEGLAMTYGNKKNYAFTAEDIVNDWAEEDIANVLYGYGEERYSRMIAKAIVAERQKSRIVTAAALAQIIAQAVPASYRHGRINPATKSFQGLRIAVNDEFTVLETFLHDAFALLKPGGRLAVITFHSLEDRIVKLAFKAMTHDQEAVLVHKKPLAPSKEELSRNPRARSAKLRTIEKI